MNHRIHHSAPGGGTVLHALDATHIVKVGADDTGGLCELFESDPPGGHAVPLHRHELRGIPSTSMHPLDRSDSPIRKH